MIHIWLEVAHLTNAKRAPKKVTQSINRAKDGEKKKKKKEEEEEESMEGENLLLQKHGKKSHLKWQVSRKKECLKSPPFC